MTGFSFVRRSKNARRDLRELRFEGCGEREITAKLKPRNSLVRACSKWGYCQAEGRAAVAARVGGHPTRAATAVRPDLMTRRWSLVDFRRVREYATAVVRSLPAGAQLC